jgi:chaperonin GroES
MNMLRPLNDHVIVRSIKEEISGKGIIIPDTANKEKPEKGEVIAVGPGKMSKSGERMALNVKVGDRVVFTKYSPNEVKINGEEYLVLSESDLLAVIE